MRLLPGKLEKINLENVCALTIKKKKKISMRNKHLRNVLELETQKCNFIYRSSKPQNEKHIKYSNYLFEKTLSRMFLCRKRVHFKVPGHRITGISVYRNSRASKL